MKKRPIVASYYFPNWHCDPRIEALHGKGWTEWRVAQHATPRFPGHRQPRVPIWGYQDESDPIVMSQKIDAAHVYGVDAFIFDWYCFNDGPYRERCLNEGFLQAPNCEDIKFGMMWCNHNPIYVHPGNYWKPAEPNWRGDDITPETFRRETKLYIEKYLSRPNYLTVDGGKYFSIWQPQIMVKNFGGEAVAKELFAEFHDAVRAAGLGELNLNARCELIGDDPADIAKYEAWAKSVGFDTLSVYGWQAGQGDFFPAVDYGYWAKKGLAQIRERCTRFTMPFSPACPPGWDPSPRTVQSDMYEQRGYPFGPVIVNNTPERFELALREVKEMVETGVSKSELIHIPCWNEWTEGAYLEPDTVYGYGYLQAIRSVFGTR